MAKNRAEVPDTQSSALEPTEDRTPEQVREQAVARAKRGIPELLAEFTSEVRPDGITLVNHRADWRFVFGKDGRSERLDKIFSQNAEFVDGLRRMGRELSRSTK